MTARTDTEDPGTFHVLFVLVEGFSMMALSSAVEPLRAANRLLGRPCYLWTVASAARGHVPASNGMAVLATHDVEEAPEAHLTIVVASTGIDAAPTDATLALLRRLNSEGRMLGAISTATLILAQAGVIGSRRVTVHWEMQRRIAKEFPDIDLCDALYCSDSGLLTSAGGAAAMDMMLSLIAQREGEDIAADVADQFLHGRLRASTEMQRQDIQWRYKTTDKRLVRAIRLMEDSLATPLKIAQIASVAGLSERQLERRFMSELNKSPSSFYMELRLKAASEMLRTSSDSLEEISSSMGFSSLPHFSRNYKAWAKEPPSATRSRHRRENVGKLQKHGDGG